MVRKELDAQGKPQLEGVTVDSYNHLVQLLKVVFDPLRKAGDRVLSIHVLNKLVGICDLQSPAEHTMLQQMTS